MADKSFSQCKFSSRKEANPRPEKVLKNNPGSSLEKDSGFSSETQPASTDLESLTQMPNSLLEDSTSSWFGSTERTYLKQRLTKNMKLLPTEVDVPDLCPLSPVISLLSLDSCDLEAQMLIDAEHRVQTQDGTIVESLQMDMVDDLLDCSGNHGDLLPHYEDPRCKMADWMDQSEEDGRCLLETCVFPSSLDSGYGLGTSNSMSNLGQTSHEFFANVLCSQEPHRLDHDQVNYTLNHNNILEDCFDQVEPWMKINGKEDGCSNTDFYAMDGNISSQLIFPGFKSQLDQSKKFLYDIWEQPPQESPCKAYTSPVTDQIMMQDADIRNVDKNIVQVQNLPGPQCPIMCCLEGFCYHEEESCFFRGSQSSYNFEGVARSFPATLHKLHPTPIPTPPLDEDWMFSNIVPEEEVNSMSNTFGKY